MSRRSTLTHRESQHRAASRMTVGTKMWSEQPVPQDYRGKPVVSEPAVVEWVPRMSWALTEETGPGTATLTLQSEAHLGGRLLAMVGLREFQWFTPAPGWNVLRYETLNDGFLGAVVMTRIADAMTMDIGSMNGVGIFMNTSPVVLVFSPGEYHFSVDQRRSDINTGVVHLELPKPSSTRMRWFFSTSMYNKWFRSEPPGVDVGGGYINTQPSSNGGIDLDDPVDADWYRITPWLTKQDWWAGEAEHDQIGAVGYGHWVEMHVHLVAGEGDGNGGPVYDPLDRVAQVTSEGVEVLVDVELPTLYQTTEMVVESLTVLPQTKQFKTTEVAMEVLVA